MDVLGFHVGTIDVLCYGGAAVFVGYKIWAGEARRKGLREAGVAAGLAPASQDVSDLPEGLRKLPLFSFGNERGLENAMWGEGGAFVVFDFEYTHVRRDETSPRPGRKRRTDFLQTVCAVHLPDGDIPEFTLAPAGLGDAFLGLFGGRDIDLAEEPKFSGEYLLHGPDPDAIRLLFARGAARFLGENTGWTVQGKGAWVLYYKDETVVPPDRLTDFLWEARAVHTAFFGP